MAPGGRGSLPGRRGGRSTAAIIVLSAALVAAVPRGAAAETMESALAKAYENNPQLNAQRAIVRQTDEGVPTALSGYRPTISANASIGREYTDTKQDDSAAATGLAERRVIRGERSVHAPFGRTDRDADAL